MLKIKNSNQKVVATPFGAHFSTRLTGVNSKLICALSRAPRQPGGGDGPHDSTLETCYDDWYEALG